MLGPMNMLIHSKGKQIVNRLLWRSVNPDEMHVSLSLLMVIGIKKLPHVYMNWSNDVIIGGLNIFCKEVMGTARFLCLLKFMPKTLG